MTQALRIVNIKDVSVAVLESMYDEILVPSFRAAELESRTTVLGALTRDPGIAGGMLAMDPAGPIIGAIIGEWFAECRVMLISYLAVRAECRGRGVGKRLLAEARALWRELFAPALVVLESEDPLYYREHDAMGFGDPAARLRLYGGLGARILAIPYFQPAVSRHQPRVDNMLLLVFETDPQVSKSVNEVDSTIISCFIEENIARSEGRASDEQAQKLREAIRAKTAIPLVDPADYVMPLT